MSVCNLYVDGSNMYGRQYELLGPDHYLDFSQVIEKINQIYPLNKVYFYASYSPVENSSSKKLPKYILNERLFYYSARKHPKVIFYKGKRSKKSGKEKGVDVHLACDIVQHVIRKEVNRVILMSGDADLAYPMEICKNNKIKTAVFNIGNRVLTNLVYDIKNYFLLKICFGEKNNFSFSEKVSNINKIILRKNFVKKITPVQARGAD